MYCTATTLCVPLSLMDLEEFDMLSFHETMAGALTVMRFIIFCLFCFLACFTPSSDKNINGMEKAHLQRRTEADECSGVILRSRGNCIIMFVEIQPYIHTKDALF